MNVPFKRAPGGLSPVIRLIVRATASPNWGFGRARFSVASAPVTGCVPQLGAGFRFAFTINFGNFGAAYADADDLFVAGLARSF